MTNQGRIVFIYCQQFNLKLLNCYIYFILNICSIDFFISGCQCKIFSEKIYLHWIESVIWIRVKRYWLAYIMCLPTVVISIIEIIQGSNINCAEANVSIKFTNFYVVISSVMCHTNSATSTQISLIILLFNCVSNLTESFPVQH